MSLRTLRIEQPAGETFIVEVIEVMENRTGERRLDYAVGCILCDDEIANLDSLEAAVAAGREHECGVPA